ncbi:hypothetical protein BH11PLA1_BH11PLA1_08350 [soil metagenome]
MDSGDFWQNLADRQLDPRLWRAAPTVAWLVVSIRVAIALVLVAAATLFQIDSLSIGWSTARGDRVVALTCIFSAALTLAAAYLILGMWHSVARHRRHQREARHTVDRCAVCAYPLDGLPDSGICPECCTPFTKSAEPWLRLQREVQARLSARARRTGINLRSKPK